MSKIEDTFFVYINGIPYDYDRTMYNNFYIDSFGIDSLGDDFNHTKDSLLIVDTKRKEVRYLHINVEFVYQQDKLWVYPLVVYDDKDIWNYHFMPVITVVESGETFELFNDIAKLNTDIEFVNKTLSKLAKDVVAEMRTKTAAIIP